ncbi:MAG: hypothetical protein IPK82_38275 [Polyangiaceae bacterium]|nr:hypothetical protein [Polyangiaceae bacterium]
MAFLPMLKKLRYVAALGMLAASLAPIGGCTDEEPPPETSTAPVSQCGGGAPKSFLISTLGFTRIDETTGKVKGFNLDGVVSDGTDEASCFKKDFVSFSGEKGVDNQLASLIPDVEAILGDAVDGLIQGAINNGGLLIFLTVERADNLQNDDCVDLTVTTVLGKPTLGTNGVIEAYQTFDPDPEGEVSHATGGKIVNGELTIGPFELAIPIAIFDVAFTIHVHDALFKLKLTGEDGVAKEGLLGGGVVPQEILDGVAPGAGVDQYIPVLTLVLNGSTDLEIDEEGTCQQVSAALQITAVEAFLRP